MNQPDDQNESNQDTRAAQGNAKDEGSKLLWLACGLVHADYEIARKSNAFDRSTIVGDAAMLVLIWVLACIAWFGFWATVLSATAASMLGVLLGTMTAMLDRAMGASDWTLSGVLRQANPDAAWWARVVLRCALGLLLAQATAFGLQMTIFESSIKQQLQRERIEANAPVEKDYQARIAQNRSDLTAPIEAERKTLAAEREQLLSQISADDALRRGATQRAANQGIEASREEEGDQQGYQAGRGPKFKEAMRQQAAADALSAQSAGQVNAARERLKALDQRAKELSTQATTAATTQQTEAARLEAAKETDPRWSAQLSDPILAMQALHTLKSDPKRGGAVKEIVWLTDIVMLCLEFAFLAVKMLFAPASVYMVQLIANTKYEAEAITADYQRRLRALHAATPRPGLRVVTPVAQAAGSAQPQPQVQPQAQERGGA